MTEEIIDEIAEETPEAPKITKEEAAAAWENYVKGEVMALLETFLPESINGNVGVKYIRPVIKIDPKTDKAIIDEKRATGVQIYIEFDFADTVEFFDEKPEE